MGRRPDGLNAKGSLHKGEYKHPKKKFFRARAHCNPLNDQHFEVPKNPGAIDWSEHYPAYFKAEETRTSQVEFADIGCGFGGLLIRLATVYPDKLLLGMEIRDKDPHFKVTNHKRRIIQPSLLAEYAYCLQPGGMIYTITDVQELGEWMRENLDKFALFERVSDEELENDPAANLLTESSEEGQKVARNSGQTFRNVYRRLPDPES